MKNRLQCVSTQLIRIAIEGPELTDVNFEEILDIFGQKNRHIQSAIDHNYYSQFNFLFGNGGGVGGGLCLGGEVIPSVPHLCIMPI